MTIKLTKEEVMKIIGEKLFFHPEAIKDIWTETGTYTLKNDLENVTIYLEVNTDEAL